MTAGDFAADLSPSCAPICQAEGFPPPALSSEMGPVLTRVEQDCPLCISRACSRLAHVARLAFAPTQAFKIELKL